MSEGIYAVYNHQLCMRKTSIPINISFFILCATFLVQTVSAASFTIPQQIIVGPPLAVIFILVMILVFIAIYLNHKNIWLEQKRKGGREKPVIVLQQNQNTSINESQPAYQRDCSYTPPESAPKPPLWDMLFLSDEEYEVKKKQMQDIYASQPSLTPSNSASQFSSSTAAFQHYMAEIEKFAELRDRGLLTNEEFEIKKQQILGIKKSPSESVSPNQKESEQSTLSPKTISDDDEIIKVLKMRYAKGEISFEEYQEMCNNLKK